MQDLHQAFWDFDATSSVASVQAGLGCREHPGFPDKCGDVKALPESEAGSCEVRRRRAVWALQLKERYAPRMLEWIDSGEGCEKAVGVLTLELEPGRRLLVVCFRGSKALQACGAACGAACGVRTACVCATARALHVRCMCTARALHVLALHAACAPYVHYMHTAMCHALCRTTRRPMSPSISLPSRRSASAPTPPQPIPLQPRSPHLPLPTTPPPPATMPPAAMPTPLSTPPPTPPLYAWTPRGRKPSSRPSPRAQPRAPPTAYYLLLTTYYLLLTTYYLLLLTTF